MTKAQGASNSSLAEASSAQWSARPLGHSVGMGLMISKQLFRGRMLGYPHICHASLLQAFISEHLGCP